MTFPNCSPPRRGVDRGSTERLLYSVGCHGALEELLQLQSPALSYQVSGSCWLLPRKSRWQDSKTTGKAASGNWDATGLLAEERGKRSGAVPHIIKGAICLTSKPAIQTLGWLLQLQTSTLSYQVSGSCWLLSWKSRWQDSRTKWKAGSGSWDETGLLAEERGQRSGTNPHIIKGSICLTSIPTIQK